MFISLDLSRDLSMPDVAWEGAAVLSQAGIALPRRIPGLVDGPFELAGVDRSDLPASNIASPLFFALCAKALREATPYALGLMLGVAGDAELIAASRWSSGKPLVVLLGDQPSRSSLVPDLRPDADAVRCLLVSDAFLNALSRQITSTGNAVDLITAGLPVATLAIAGIRDPLAVLSLAERLLARDTVYTNCILEIDAAAVDVPLLERLKDFPEWKISAAPARAGAGDSARDTIVLVLSKQSFGSGIRDPANIARSASLTEMLTRPVLGALASRKGVLASQRSIDAGDWKLPGRTYVLREPDTCVPLPHPFYLARVGHVAGCNRGASRRRNVYTRNTRFYGIDANLALAGPQRSESAVLAETPGAAGFPLDRIIDAPTLVMSLHTSAHAYYHYLIEYLPTLSVLLQDTASARCLVAASAFHAFHHESLALMGVEDPILCGLDDGILLRDAILPTIVCQSDAVDFLRARTIEVAPDGHARRLYVTRRSATTRRVVNELDLLPVLSRYGFEIIETEALSFCQQIALFKAAEAVCGPHGAGLSNIVFASSGCRVIEFVLGEKFPMAGVFWELACAAGQPYSALVARMIPNAYGSPSEGDLFVDPDVLEQLLARALPSEVEGRHPIELALISDVQK